MPNIVSSSQDSAMLLSEEQLQVLENIDKVVDKAVTTGNYLVAVRYGMALRATQQVAGLALAKLLYDMRERWEMFPSDDDFATIAQYELGISSQTYNKYLDAWEFVINHPYLQKDPDLQKRIMGKPWKGILLLNAAAKEDQIDPEHWEELAKAPNVQAIAILRDLIRGSDKTKGKAALKILLQKDGKLRARIGHTAYEDVGYVKRDDTKLANAVISRLESCGVVVEPAK